MGDNRTLGKGRGIAWAFLASLGGNNLAFDRAVKTEGNPWAHNDKMLGRDRVVVVDLAVVVVEDATVHRLVVEAVSLVVVDLEYLHLQPFSLSSLPNVSAGEMTLAPHLFY